ncbi:MAG TPA: BatA domain-containing protein [Pyrinomonadaceae bacterium]
MSFLSPLTLIGLSLVALPLLIHLLVRRRARRLDFPSLAFLRETPSFKLYPRRIRQPLLLALRAAALILLILGLARPFLTSNAQRNPQVRFLLLDASLSMRTHGRAEAAREQARAIINKLRDGERASLISFSSTAAVLVEASSDRGKLLEAVERYEPGGGAADYNAALAEVRARRTIEPPGVSDVDIISDFQTAGIEKRLGPHDAALRLRAYPVGQSVERNAYLINESVSKSANGIELSATEMVSESAGRGAAVRAWTMDANEGSGPALEWRTESNGQITARAGVLEPDEFDADDERFFAFHAPRETRVLLIEDGKDASLYLRAALEVAGDEGAARGALDRQRELPERAEDLAQYSLVVLTLHGTPKTNEVAALTEYAREGGTVWMCLGGDLDTESWNLLARDEAGRGLPFESVSRSSGKALSFGSADAGAPQMRALDESAMNTLRAVQVTAGYAIAPRAYGLTLARWNDENPALVSLRVGEGEILAIGTSVERASNDLGSSPVFPLLASAIVRASNITREPISRSIGEAVRLDTKPETNVKITNMAGRVVEPKARELASRPMDYFNVPGIYRLEFAGNQKFLAFNPPAEESERALLSEESLNRLLSSEKPTQGWTASEGNRLDATEREGFVWRYFLGAAFLLLIAELFVATRRRTLAQQEGE